MPVTQKRLTILAVGAHPDDIELGCGATLLRYREEGHETHGLVLSAGEGGLGGSVGPQDNPRVQEAQDSARIMGLKSITIHHFPDTLLATRQDDIKCVIEEVTRRCHPDVVFTHNRFDLHSDHRAVYEATLVAARRVPTMLCYENPNTPTTFQPNLFIDIAHYLEDKLRALKCHSSQSDTRPYMDGGVVGSWAKVRGQQARIHAAEAFETVRVVRGAI
jgi:LmbE family N-acetylglucosaminyl deacetylase